MSSRNQRTTVKESVGKNFTSASRGRNLSKRSLHKSSSMPQSRSRPGARSPVRHDCSISPRRRRVGSPSPTSQRKGSESSRPLSPQSVQRTFVRAQTAREYYFPQSPRMLTGPHSARDLLSRLELEDQQGHSRRSRPSSPERRRDFHKELSNREKIKKVEDSIIKSSDIKFSLSASKSYASSVIPSRVVLPKIMPCQRPESIILAQAEQRITRRLIAKELQEIAQNDLKSRVEQRELERQDKRRRQKYFEDIKGPQRALVSFVQSVTYMSLLVNTLREHRREIMRKSLRKSIAVVKTPAVGGGGKSSMSTASAFITNPDGSQEVFADDVNDESDYSLVPGVDINMYAKMTAAYRMFLQIMKHKKWRLVVALSILRKRAACRVLKSSIPFIAKGPKFTRGAAYFINRIRTVQRAARRFLNGRRARIKYLQIEWEKEDFAYTRDRLAEIRRQRLRSTIDAKIGRMAISKADKRHLETQKARWAKTNEKMKLLLQKHDEDNAEKVASPLDIDVDDVVISDDYVEQYMLPESESCEELFEIIKEKRRLFLSQKSVYSSSSTAANHSLDDAKVFLGVGLKLGDSTHATVFKTRKNFFIQKYLQPGEIRERVIKAHARAGTFDGDKSFIYKRK